MKRIKWINKSIRVFFSMIVIICLCILNIPCSKGTVLAAKYKELPENKKTSALHYVAIGDSITEGTGMEKKEDSFASQFAEKLKCINSNIDYKNYGKQGLTTKQITKNLQSESVKDSIEQADYITVTAGGNDILALAVSSAQAVTKKDYKNAKKIPKIVKSNTTAKLLLKYMKKEQVQKEIRKFLDDFSNDFSELLDTVSHENPDTVILVQTIYNPAKGSKYQALSECIDSVLKDVNEEIKQCVNEKEDSRILLLDTYSLFEDHADLYVRIGKDDIHPTKEGHQFIATALYQTVLGHNPSNTNTIKENQDTKETLTTNIQTENEQDSNALIIGKQRLLTYFGTAFMITMICVLIFQYFRKMH